MLSSLKAHVRTTQGKKRERKKEEVENGVELHGRYSPREEFRATTL